MSRLRFATVLEVYDAFPTLRDDITASPSEDAPIPFLEGLAATPTPEDAITFCAYLLPRREAVWWACQCARGLLGIAAEDGDDAMRSAEDWVRLPEDGQRVAALNLGMAADRLLPTTWLALAAGWSGGSLVHSHHGPVPAQPYMTARAARAALLIALAKVPARDRATQIRICVASGVKLLDGAASSGR